MTYEAQSTKAKVKGLGDRIERHESLINILIIVLFVGFAGVFVTVGAMILDAFRGKQATYQALTDKITEQNIRIELMMEQMKERQTTAQVITNEKKK